MVKIWKYLLITLTLFSMFLSVSATQQQILVEMNEYVNQHTLVNPLKFNGGVGLYANNHEEITQFNYTGYIIVSNKNLNNETISDIYVSFGNTGNITLPVAYSGRNSTWVSNNTASQILVLHIPELKAGENTTLTYQVNTSTIVPPLNLNTSFSNAKLLAGENFTLTDSLINNFDNFSHQTDTCINSIYLTQNASFVNFSGLIDYWKFLNNSTFGVDASNVTYSANNLTQYWNVLNGGCLNKTQITSISYNLTAPLAIPKSKYYELSNTTLKYTLNWTISHLNVTDIIAVGKAGIGISKKIVGPADPILYGSTVTWEVNGIFNVTSNISYELRGMSLWVSQRNVNGNYTDPNTIDNDSISNTSLVNILSPYVIVNKTAPWTSLNWLFNYSDVPSPIVWNKVNFTIQNDGTQLVNRVVTRNGADIYVKELYLILGYWLEIHKNITNLGNNEYQIDVTVRNKGNQATPADTVVTIYDFIPANFNLTSNFSYSNSGWYNTTMANNSIVGGNFTGMLYQFGLIPSNFQNTSFATGPALNVNTTWSVTYNVTGLGDYNLVDVFITGLDPQQVDGAGSSKTVVVSEVINRMKGTEGIFATIASILLLVGLIL